MPSSAGTSALGITLVLTTHVSAIAVISSTLLPTAAKLVSAKFERSAGT